MYVVYEMTTVNQYYFLFENSIFFRSSSYVFDFI